VVARHAFFLLSDDIETNWLDIKDLDSAVESAVKFHCEILASTLLNFGLKF